ncbi:hypothetical protein DFH06DRAFT_586436 [Mycena polygramma]|nr:hypothetical protein DFH06DRAFT_586436 [Mycena polygramma]
MHDAYDAQGDAIMRDAALPDLAMDQLAAKFSRFCLEDPPIHRVPDDLLYELFMSLAGQPSAENCDFCVLLSHVCSNWRSIIVRAPLLWKFVAMYSSGSPRDHSLTVESFLCRSLDQPISFAFSIRKAPLSKSPLVRILRPHAARVTSLRFTACNYSTLWSHLVDLSRLALPSLEYHEGVIRWNGPRAPGTFAAVSRTPKPNSVPPVFIPTAAIPAWPHHLDTTSLSFCYSSLKLSDIFLLIETAQTTLQHLKLYFQNRDNVIPSTHWLLMDGPIVELLELRSMDLGYNDPLSLVPFLHRVNLPSLESLSLHDFNSCPEPDMPDAEFATLPAQPSTTSPHHLSARPLDRLLSALVDAVPAPEILASLSLTGLDCFAATALESALDYLGPDLRKLNITRCGPELLEALMGSAGCGGERWHLERLTVTGMDTDELVRCLWVRHGVAHGRLEVVCLERPLALLDDDGDDTDSDME